MDKIKAAFERAKAYRQQSSETSNFKAAKKLALAESALDETEVVISLLINEVETLKHGKN